MITDDDDEILTEKGQDFLRAATRAYVGTSTTLINLCHQRGLNTGIIAAALIHHAAMTARAISTHFDTDGYRQEMIEKFTQIVLHGTIKPEEK